MYQITVNINDKPHQKRIPQSWHDVQWTDYITALQSDGELLAVLEALTGIPRHIIDAMSETDRTFIETQCSFFWNDELIKEGLPVDFVKVQIENDTWQKLIDCEQEFKRVTDANLPHIAAAQLVIKTYTKEQMQIKEMNRLNDLAEKEAKENGQQFIPLTLNSKEIKDIQGIDIKSLSVPKALAYWDFFLPNSMIGRRDGQTSMNQKQMRMRSRQELRNFKRSRGLLLLTLLRKGTLRSMMPSLTRRPMSSTPSYSRIKLNRSTLRTLENTMSSSVKKETNE